MRASRSSTIAAALVVSWLASPAACWGQGAAVANSSARSELGLGIFQQRCLSCHGKAEYERAPSPGALRAMSAEHLYDTLTNGIMFAVVGNQLTDQERKLTAESISGHLLGTAKLGDAAGMPNRCSSNPPLSDPKKSPAWNGWGANLGNTRFQSTQSAGLDLDSVASLKLRWAFGFPNGASAYGQPAVVSHRVFVGADTGYVYSLDAQSGCVYWSFAAHAGVRNAMTVERRGDGYAVYFGDVKANVYALDARTGSLLWSTLVEDNLTARITAAPAFYEGTLYVPISSWEEYRAVDPTYGCCTSRGAVTALDARTGRMLWKRYVIDKRPHAVRANGNGVTQFSPAGGAVWNTPTVDAAQHAIYFGTGDGTTYPAAENVDTVMALEMRTGRSLWSYHVHRNDSYLVGCGANSPLRSDNCPRVVGPDWDIPGSVILTANGGRRSILVGTKPGDVLALDPDHAGRLQWRKNVAGGALAGDGPQYLNGKRQGVMWGGAIADGTIFYGMTEGGVVAMQIATGATQWTVPLNDGAARKVSYGAAVTAIPHLVFAGGADGSLFAMSSQDGRVLWSFDTAQSFTTVNGVSAKGGSISAAGPVVAGGLLLVGSGYSTIAGEPGNVLLAFASEHKVSP